MNKLIIKLTFLIILLTAFSVFTNAQTQIIINEFSQGDMADHDWIELVVTEDGADIRGVYFTTTTSPNAADYSTKSVQLSTTLGAFVSVKKGFVIVIYKANNKDLNLPIDDRDSTTNSRIIIPSDDPTYIENPSVWPAFKNTAGDNIGLLAADGVGIHAVSYGSAATISSKFGPGSWGQVIIPNTLDDGASTSLDNSAYYKFRSSGQAGNSGNWGVRSHTNVSPGTIDGSIDSGTPSVDIIINEFSQGGTADQDWIELVVTKDGADIRGVYFTTSTSPNAADYSTKSVQLSTTLGAFASVKKGFIIVIYKALNKDTNLPADDRDSTTNSRIIIPNDDPTYIESPSIWPAFKGSAGDNIGLLTAGGVGLHAVSYGSATTVSSLFGPGSWGQIIIPSDVLSGKSAHFVEGTDSDAKNSANWLVGVAANTFTSPGTLNGGNNNALPVELVSFSAILKENAVQLNWMTATEVNNYGFDIERKRDGEDWSILGFIEGNGNSNSPKEYSYIDNNVSNSGKYYYRLKQIDNDGSFEYSKFIFVDLNVPVKFELKQNYPNPFNPSTTITFTLPVNEVINLKIYNMLGEEIRILQNGFLEAGTYSYNFNADGLPSGFYIYQISSASHIQSKKMLLLK